MPVVCRHKQRHGWPACHDGCPAVRPGGVFRHQRVGAPGELPPADARIVDVAVLDMNFRWPNLGHDSLVHAVQDAACDLQPALEAAGLAVRALSFEIRAGHQIPDGPGGGRFALYLGTGGPGHLDPRANDGQDPGSQGVHEDPAWEGPLFRLFDAIDRSEEGALLAVCHTFGVLCRWAGVAEPALRTEAKGGKSAGVQENLLTAEARRHPWFGTFAAELPEGRRLRVVDHRLFDLIPGPERPGRLAIGHEARGLGGPAGDALTMMEFARDPGGVMPRVFGSNHHPEVVDRARQMLVLEEKRLRGEVSAEWIAERQRVLSETYADDADDRRLQLTSDYTLLWPLRFHLYRQVRRRAGTLGLSVDVHEEQALTGGSPVTADR